MTQTTIDLVAALQAYPPPGATERDAVDQVKALAAIKFPFMTDNVVGEALMHVAHLHVSVIAALRETDPMLDWESLVTLAHNIIGVAGMELYTGTVLGETPEGEGT